MRKKLFLVGLMAFVLALGIVGCSSGSNDSETDSETIEKEPEAIIGEWQGDCIISYKSYTVSVDAQEDGTISMKTMQVTHSTSSIGFSFEGTWEQIEVTDVPGVTKDGSGEGYKIDFNGVTYYALVTGGTEDKELTLTIMAYTSENKVDMTKPVVTAHPVSDKESLSAEELDAQIAEQPVRVINTEYLVYDETYKNLNPDFMSATILNESGSAIKTVTIGYVAWDENGLPVTITSKGSSKDLYYVETTMTNANIPNGESWNEQGLALSGNKQSDISQFRAIVTSYTDYDGNSWTNPLLEDWQNTFENKPLQ